MTTAIHESGPANPATIAQWRDLALAGMDALRKAYGRFVSLDAHEDPAWIQSLDEIRLERELGRLESLAARSDDPVRDYPLFGVPFAVKDNIDVGGWTTTAACPSFAYEAASDAEVVTRLRDAGAVVVGKTNLDQFATGLVGTRSPYGAVPCVFDPSRIGGGSSSGSASVVSRGIVPFALGTDTAGSGRVPAGFQNIVGLKPTRGWLSTRGVVPACRTLDCVSIFALSAADAQKVSVIAGGHDGTDAYSRPSRVVAAGMRTTPRFAVPATLEFHGDKAAAAAFAEARTRLVDLGVELTEIDFSPFAELAALLYQGPWVAERLSVVQDLLEAAPDSIHPVVRSIVEAGTKHSALDTFRAEYRRRELASAIATLLDRFDALLVPTAPFHPTLAQVENDPVGVNSRLGAYTNFANLADLSAIALPGPFRIDGLPAGITLLAPAWHDQALAEFGSRWLASLGQPCGIAMSNPTVHEPIPPRSECVELAVVGAHLSGMPLNHQLVSRRSRLLRACKTAPGYTLHALTGTVPQKPGLARGPGAARIELEVWEVPTEAFGSFVTEIPQPLGIGNVQLEDGRWVKGFICEGAALETARDITAYGGWRAYLASQKTPTASPLDSQSGPIANQAISTPL